MKSRRKQKLHDFPSMGSNDTAMKQNTVINKQSTSDLSTNCKKVENSSNCNAIDELSSYSEKMKVTVDSGEESMEIVSKTDVNGKRLSPTDAVPKFDSTDNRVDDDDTSRDNTLDEDFIQPKKFCAVQQQTLPPPIETSNRFIDLSPQETDKADSSPVSVSTTKQQGSSVPAIYIYNVTNRYKLIKQLLDKCNVKPQILNMRYTIKVKCLTYIDYTATINLLKCIGEEFSTDTAKSDQLLKVVIRNLPVDTPLVDIKEALIYDDIPCTEVKQLHSLNSETKKREDLPLFLAYIQRTENAKRVYNLTSLIYCKIRVEPYKSKDIIQCYKCQRYNHSERSCHANPRCVKCAGPHVTRQCTKALTTKDLKCVNCMGNHTANYRGCPVYLQHKGKKLPTTVQNNDALKQRKTVTQAVPNSSDFPKMPQTKNVSQQFTNIFKSSTIRQTKVNSSDDDMSHIQDNTSLMTIKDVLSIFKEFDIRNKLDIIKSFMIKYKKTQDAIEKITIILECVFNLIDNGSE